MNARIAALVVGVATVVALVAGCNDTSPRAGCTPGAVSACACPGGGSGAQTCATGGFFGPCLGCPSTDGGLPTLCGDGTCNGAETCTSCPSDCGACVVPFCGDGTCGASETCSSCASDCGTCAARCGDGSCNGGETCSTCAGDCGTCAPTCAIRAGAWHGDFVVASSSTDPSCAGAPIDGTAVLSVDEIVTFSPCPAGCTCGAVTPATLPDCRAVSGIACSDGTGGGYTARKVSDTEVSIYMTNYNALDQRCDGWTSLFWVGP